jgi:hypothetical protein
MPKRGQRPKRRSPEAQSPGPGAAAPMPAVLSFLKDTRGALTWTSRDLEGCLHVPAKAAAQILAILEMQDYVRRKENSEEYLTTASGETVSESKLPRLKRESVEKALETMADRIAAVNRDPRGKYTIPKAVAFGDFLSDRRELQAADLGVMLTRRRPPSGGEQNDEEERVFLKELQAKNRFVHLRRYQNWMSQRSHRRLL